ncbi:MAG: hypothetical protein GEU73_18060, partial [Chloroflexi bacterium]|nr:hypothetical protein [Chloroflexota bacterium]
MTEAMARAATVDTPARTWAGPTVRLLSCVFLAAVVVQVFLAGAFVFGATDPGPHRELGFVLPLLPLIMVIVAAVGRLPVRVTGLTAILLALTVLQ